MVTDSQYKALYLLGSVTGGSFDVWRLAGPANTKLRQDLLTILTGVKRSKALSGVTALKTAYFALTKVPDGCIAAKDKYFEEWAKKVLTEPRQMPSF